MREELFNGLSKEQIAKVKACKSADEVMKLAKEEGVELNDEQLEAVSGGSICAPVCPNCGTKDNVYKSWDEATQDKYICKKCGAICGDFGF